jgi:hypothetical protein
MKRTTAHRLAGPSLSATPLLCAPICLDDNYFPSISQAQSARQRDQFPLLRSVHDRGHPHSTRCARFHGLGVPMKTPTLYGLSGVLKELIRIPTGRIPCAPFSEPCHPLLLTVQACSSPSPEVWLQTRPSSRTPPDGLPQWPDKQRLTLLRPPKCYFK